MSENFIVYVFNIIKPPHDLFNQILYGSYQSFLYAIALRVEADFEKYKSFPQITVKQYYRRDLILETKFLYNHAVQGLGKAGATAREGWQPNFPPAFPSPLQPAR